MKNEKNSNKLNNLLYIININENIIQKRNETSYKFFVNNKKMKNKNTSSSFKNIYLRKEGNNKKLPGYLYIKDFENTKYFNNILVGNINPNISNSNISFNKYKTIQKNNYISIKKKSTLPYLYRNLYKKNISNKFLNFQKAKINPINITKLSDNNSKESSFLPDSNLKNIFFNKNDNISLSNKIRKIYSRIKYNKLNKTKIDNNNNINNRRYPINKPEFENLLRKNNSEIYYNRDLMINTNKENEMSLSDRAFKKDKKYKKNNFIYDKDKTLEFKRNLKDFSNSKSILNEKNISDININKLNLKKSENTTNNDIIKDIKIIKIKESKNYINKKIINNNPRNDTSNECENERETMSNNMNEIEENLKDEKEKDINIDDEQDKLFNTNQKNFFKFRKDIKEEPELEEDIE